MPLPFTGNTSSPAPRLSMPLRITERLWRTVKYAEVYLHDYASPREARQALTRYFQFYNRERPHQALENQTPAEVYFHTMTAGLRQNE